MGRILYSAVQFTGENSHKWPYNHMTEMLFLDELMSLTFGYESDFQL